MDKIPAGIKGANTGGICIENTGNFDVGGDSMSAAQRDTIVQLNAALCRKFRLAPNTDTIVYHHWYDLNTGARTNGAGTTKTCPGTGFFGGNTVADAAANFVPLVAAALGVTASPILMAHATFIVNASSLNVREAPDGAARVVKQLTRGVHVDAFETRAGWKRVHATEQQWASARFLLEVS
jgi:N-acetylmuramoyl-L-alanine amidase